MLLDQSSYMVNFPTGEAVTAIEPQWVKPKLRLCAVMSDVNVGRLVNVAGVEKESIRPAPQHGRHDHMLSAMLRPSNARAKLRFERCQDSISLARTASHSRSIVSTSNSSARAVGPRARAHMISSAPVFSSRPLKALANSLRRNLRR